MTGENQTQETSSLLEPRTEMMSNKMSFHLHPAFTDLCGVTDVKV